MNHKRICAALLACSVLLCGCKQHTEVAVPPETTAIIEGQQLQTTTETQTSPLTAVVRSERIPKPEGMHWLSQLQRTDDGITCFGSGLESLNTHLIRYTDDLSDYTVTTIVRQAPYDGYYNVGTIYALHDGQLYGLSVMENHSNLPPVEEADEHFDWDTYNATWESDYYLCTYADDGTITSATPIEGLEDYQKNGYDQISSLYADDNGVYIVLTDGRILRVEQDGSLDVIKPPQTGGEILDGMGGRIFRDTNGRTICMQTFYCSRNGNSYEMMQLTEFDSETGTFSEPFFSVDLSGAMSRAWAEPGFGEYRVIVSMEDKVIGLKADGTEETLIDWNASDMMGMTVFPLEDGTFLATGYDENGSQILYRLTRKTVAEVESVEKQELTVGILYSESALSDFVRTFNREHDEMKVNIVSYADEEGYWDLDKFKLDIISGDAPDIIIIHENHEAVRQLGKRGAFLDLNPFLQTTPDMNPEIILPNILEAMTAENGAVYSLPNGFAVATAAVKTKFCDKEHWTVDDLMALYDGATTDQLKWHSQDDMLRMLLYGTDFTDEENGKCSFDSPEFKQILELCGRFTVEVPEPPKDYNDPDAMVKFEKYHYDLFRRYQRDEDLMLTFGLTGRQNSPAGSYSYARYLDLGEDMTLVGYPSDNGEGGRIQFMSEISISSACEHPDLAWEFVKYYLQSEDIYGYSILEERFEEQLDDEMYIKNFEDVRSDLEYYEDDGMKIYPLTQAERDYVEEYIRSCETVLSMSEEIINIVSEEAEMYFAGDISVDEAARRIQSRAEIYISEQS